MNARVTTRRIRRARLNGCWRKERMAKLHGQALVVNGRLEKLLKKRLDS